MGCGMEWDVISARDVVLRGCNAKGCPALPMSQKYRLGTRRNWKEYVLEYVSAHLIGSAGYPWNACLIAHGTAHEKAPCSITFGTVPSLQSITRVVGKGWWTSSSSGIEPAAASSLQRCVLSSLRLAGGHSLANR